MTRSDWDAKELRVRKYQDLSDDQKATVRLLTTAEAESAIRLGETRVLALVDGNLERVWIDTIKERSEPGYSKPYIGRTCEQTLITGYPMQQGWPVAFGPESMVE